MYSRTNEVPLLKLKHADTKLKFLKERIAVIEREIKQFSPEILESRSPEERLAFYKQLDLSEGEKLIFSSMQKKSEEKKIKSLFRSMNSRFRNYFTPEVFLQKRKLSIFM